MNMKATSPKRAGGRATEAGMDFQAGVGTWLAAHLLVRLPVGGRFGMANTALPISLQLETGEGLDDTLLLQEDGSRIDVQCKTQASLSASETSPLGETITQLVRTVVAAKSFGTAIDSSKVRAVLAVRADAPRSLDNLEKGCRALDAGGAWATTKAQRSKKEQEALDVFERLVCRAWAAHTTIALDDDDLVTMARLFRIVRFSMDENEDNWREAARLLGSRLYGSEAAGDAPLRDLKAIVRGLIGSGAPADRAGLLRALRVRGHNDVGAADYQSDLLRLTAATDAELTRLAVHTKLPIADGISISRDSDGPLANAVASGSLIVIGEPGAGKTGALVALAQSRRVASDTVIFLSVDRFPGIGLAADLQSELKLSHPLVDVLAAAPGTGGKLLIIDALDAARGGPAEEVFAQLIETLSALPETPWTVVASIRTFDLKNGRRFRHAMPGSPPDPNFAETSLENVRHFKVPRLSENDLDYAATVTAELGSLLEAATEKLRDLLRNVFNLSLAAQLLTDGASPASIRTLATQSDLIDAYEDHRLTGTALQRAAAAAVGAMVQRRRLAVRKVVVAHDYLDKVIQSGVLAEAGDLVSFSHHVLFDHVAGRFFLEWDDSAQLIGQLGGDTSLALMLASGLRFAIERLWRSDTEDKPMVWRFVADLYLSTTVDPVLANVALRSVIECVTSDVDISGLTHLVSVHAGERAIAIMLSRLARFVRLAIDKAGTVAPPKAIAWASVAEACIVTGNRDLSDPTLVLLYTLFDKGDLADPALLGVFGRAARALLALAWAAHPPMQQTASSAIRFVGRSFASNAPASRALLDQALRDPHFSAHADREATWLAEQITPIAQSDPEFAIEIYRVLFSRDITDDATSYLGGQPSRIMPLSSHRSQDYRMCQYHLRRQVGRLLELSPSLGTRAVVEVTLGGIARDRPQSDDRGRVTIPGSMSFDLLGHGSAFDAWDAPDEDHGTQQNDDVLAHYVAFLRTASAAAYTESIEAAATGYTSPALWARLLSVGAERVAEVTDLLWPYATNITILAREDIVCDAVRFLAAAYPERSLDDRAAFEAEALRPDLFEDEQEQRWWRHMLGRLLSFVNDAVLATEAMRALRRELAQSDELCGNPPLRTMTTRWESSDGITRRLMANHGLNVDEGVDARMLTQSEALYSRVQTTPSTSGTAALAALWAETEATVEMYDALAGELHEQVERPVWGHISNAVERIASSPAFVPGSDGLPDMATFLALLARLWTSRFPEPKDAENDAMLSWSNWDVRVYAANAYVSIADRFGTKHGEIVNIFDTILADAVPQVRLQVAQNLQVLSQIAPERMWSLAEQVARDEPHAGVLGFFLHYVLYRFTWHDVERCEAMIELVRARPEAVEHNGKTGRDEIAAALGSLTAQLWVWQERPKALEWLTAWAGEPLAHREFLTSFLSKLRDAFFARYAEGEKFDGPVADRAKRGAMVILEACSTIAAQSYASVTESRIEGAARDTAIAVYQAAESVIGHLISQLYFGSGAYPENKEAKVGLINSAVMRQFLDDYGPMLELLAASHEPSTHHYLVELYEFLIPGDPAGVFNALHALLLGAGEREGYHQESLACSATVRIVTRYVADYRSIFEDDARRTKLISILRLFSDVGWPDALGLLYNLPELLR